MQTIKYKQWVNQIDDNLFFADLRATLDGVESGVQSVYFVNQWLEHKGYRLNWETYDLEKVKTH